VKVLAPVVLLLAGSGFLFAKEAYRTFESLDRRDDLGLGVDFFVDEELKAKKLTYRHQGRDFRITDVHGRIVREIFA